MAKQKKRKKVSYSLIERDSPVGEAMYDMLADIVREHHDELHETKARIALAWNMAWQPDVDGRLTLGKCKKASDLDRELAAFDFVIVLNMEFWQSADVKDWQRRALLDHELCHATVKLDEAGDPVIDERGRTVFRTRKHDIEEFSQVVARHGCYKRDLEHFARALRLSKQGGIPFDEETAAARVAADPKVREAVRRMAPRPGSGVTSVTVEAGGKSVTLTQEDGARMDAEHRGRA
jgi:hypothetical protein